MSQRPLPKPIVSPERIEAMWQQSSARILVGPRRRRAALRAVAVVGALTLVVAGAQLARSRVTPGGGAELAALDEPSQVTLADGSEVRLSTRTRVTLDVSRPDEVTLTMRGGRATFAVTRRASRVFRVLAGGVEVRVLGTRFGVDTAQGVEVWVEEGVVEVRAEGEVLHLTAGQAWRSGQGSAAAPPRGTGAGVALEGADPGEGPAPTPAAGQQEASAGSTGASTGAPEPHPVVRPGPARAGGARGHATGNKPAAPAPAAPQAVEAPAGGPSAGGAVPLAPSGGGGVVGSTAAGPSADERFAAALAARRAGRVAEARVAWADFLARAPDDPRAGLAAFELGRLAMDVEHDDRAALRSLDEALQRSPNAAFVEDALARVAKLQARAGDLDACRKTRAQSARKFPQGAYAASLATLCP